MNSADVVSFGCRLNMAEGEAIREAAGNARDLIIFNTCAVTAEAERQARQAIRKAAKAHPDKRIIVTGCGAEVSRAAFEAMPEVTGVVGNLVKGAADSWLKPLSFRGGVGGGGCQPAPNTLSPSCTPHPNPVDLRESSGGRSGWPTPEGEGLAKPALSGLDHARAFVEVQNGCDHDCTFCVTTLARGPSRSLPAGAIIEAIQRAVARGQQEAVLTAVDLTSYGADLPGKPSLGLLVERILKAVPDLPRLRLSSLDCIEIDDRLFEQIAHQPRLMPHLHLSLQSGDDMILKRMKRRHSRTEAVSLVQRLKTARPGLSIGADLIAGFPTEDEAMFANTLALLDDADIVLAHIFPYSPRPGTAAARMPQVGKAVAKERAAVLRARAAERKAGWLASMVGSVQQVVVERGGIGHAPNFARVKLSQESVRPERVEGPPFLLAPPAMKKGSPSTRSGQTEIGRIVHVRITGSDGDTLLGAPL